jgi:hypothetical protein
VTDVPHSAATHQDAALEAEHAAAAQAGFSMPQTRSVGSRSALIIVIALLVLVVVALGAAVVLGIVQLPIPR